LFAEASATREAPSAGLTTRILADADANQPRPQPLRTTPPRSRGWFETLADWFGGGVSLAGMSASAAVGLYLGVAQPASVLALSDWVGGTTTLESLELLPSAGTLWVQE
jgi:hypothetical protein